MPPQPFWPTRAEDRSEYERNGNRIIELPCDRNEVRDEVNGQREVADEPCKQDLVPPSDSGIGDQTPHENDAVRDEPCERSAIRPATTDEEQDDDEEVQTSA